MVAVPFLSPPTAALELPPAEKARLRARWAAWWEPLRDEIREAPPAEDSVEERAVLVRFVSGAGQTLGEFASIIEPVLRSAFDKLLQDLVTAEDAQAATERRLGLKFLSRAVQVLDAFFEMFRAFGRDQPALFSNLPTSSEQVAGVLTPALISILRLELAVFVAFDLAQEGTPTEFVAWARRSLDASNHAAPYLSSFFRAAAPSSDSRSDPLSADVSLPSVAFDRLLELVESPPAPSSRLRGLIRGQGS